MSRNELSPQAAAELAALDAILAGEPVDEDQLELGALVDSVRALSPVLDQAARERIEARIADGRGRRLRGRAAGRPWSAGGGRSGGVAGGRLRGLARPRIALAGGTLVAVAIAAAAVIGSSTLNGPSRGVSGGGAPSGSPRFTPSPATGGAAIHGRTGAPAKRAGGGAEQSLSPIGATGTTAAAPTSRALAPGSSAQTFAAAGNSTKAPPNTSPAHRLVARSTSLTLAATPTQMQTVANEVVASTQRLGGIVESSNVSVRGSSSYASFRLSVPSTKLGQLISSLSSLAGVRSLNQGTNDITDSYDAARAQLAAEKVQRAALLKALAAATTLAQEQAIEQHIHRLDNAIAASGEHVGALLERGHNATVDVQLVAAKAGAAGGGGTVGRALHDALGVLDVVLAIALVALAIVLPIGLVAVLLYWATSVLRQRSRERALASSAASRA